MQDFQKDIGSLLKQFKTNQTAGLDAAQAEKNRQIYGENMLTAPKTKSFFQRVADCVKEPIILMLIAAGIIDILVNIIRYYTAHDADFFECAGIFAAIMLSVVITIVMEGRSAKAFALLAKINNKITVKVMRGGKLELLPQHQLAAGDIVILSTGDKITADGRVLKSTELFADESALTGESMPVKKDTARIDSSDTPLAERSNMLYAGNYIVNGHGRMLVTAVGNKTEFGKVAQELTKTSHGSTPLQEKLNKLGKNITILGITAAFIIFLAELLSFWEAGALNTENVLEAFINSIVLIVAAVPEGLPTIVAVSLSLNIIKLAKQNALVKKMIASETVGCINVICSDKTGTLTENKMKVAAFYDSDGNKKSQELSSEWVAHNICLNTTADILTKDCFSGDPTECALLRFYECSPERRRSGKAYQEERHEHKVLSAFPFSSDLKHMTTISEVDKKIISYVKGSPECVLAMCDIDSAALSNIENNILKAEGSAMRVIAFAHKELAQMLDFADSGNHADMEKDMHFDGFVALIDPLRPEVYDAVQICRNSGISLKIITGDNILTTKAIAAQLGLMGGKTKAVEAKDIEKLSDKKLAELLPNISIIARSTPALKMRVVNLLKKQGNVVAVTGDGINDALALKNADVGIAMGPSGTDVAKEASDIILLDDSFATIIKAIAWGRGIYENFKRFIQFQLTVNLSSVVVVFTSIFLGLKAPFSALQLLWINIIMDGPPALTLGLEPIYDDLMKHSPVNRNSNIISRAMLLKIAVSGLFISVIFLCQYMFNFLGAEQEEVTTVLFTLFTLFQLFNAFNCRELHYMSIFKHLFKNKIMLIIIGITFILQICIIQFAGKFFNTVPLSLTMWLKLFALSLSIIILSEFSKAAIKLGKTAAALFKKRSNF